MSITFTPTAGTWTAFTYHNVEVDEAFPEHDLERTANGIIRFAREEPSIHCHNSGGYWLVGTFDLAPLDDDAYCGSVEADAIPALMRKVAQWTASCSRATDYEERKAAQFYSMLQHCRYHNCGFSWG